MLTHLTDEQRALMPAYARQWADRLLSTDSAPREEVEDAYRRCYEAAGIPWHGRVVWVSSPIVGALAAPIAAHMGVAVDGAVRGAVGDAVDGAVRGAVDGAVRGAVGGAVRGAVGDAVDGAVRDAVGGAVDGAVGGAVDGAVRGAVDGAVHDAVRGGWYRYVGGGWWGSWAAWRGFILHHTDARVPQHIRDLHATWTATCDAGWWWPHRDWVIACDRPSVIHRERVGPDGWGSHRLHCEDGPAIAWRDGWALHYWHGTRVPPWVVDAPTPGRIAAEGNAEVRRAGIESLGWDRYIDAAGLRLVAECPDPANAPHRLALYDVPRDVWDGDVRVLLATNGSPDRSGATRRYGLTIPAEISDPLSAAAWTYDVPADTYAALARRT